jgi:hypothetical protein
MIVVFGSTLYGKVESVPGVCHVATRFLHFFFVPLFPTGSWLVVDKRERAEGGAEAIKLPAMHWGSVAMGSPSWRRPRSVSSVRGVRPYPSLSAACCARSLSSALTVSCPLARKASTPGVALVASPASCSRAPAKGSARRRLSADVATRFRIAGKFSLGVGSARPSRGLQSSPATKVTSRGRLGAQPRRRRCFSIAHGLCGRSR